MKVTVICEVLGTANNGTSVAAYNLINYLKSRGHEVTVVCPDEQHRGEPGYAILPPTNLTMFSGIFEKNNVVLSRYDEEIITNAIKDADVVHILVPLFISRKTSKLVKRLGKPLTAGFHAQAENFSVHIGLKDCRIVNHIIYKWYDKNVFCRADAIHYPTQFIRDVFEKEVKRKTPGYVISNGVNSIFKPTPTAKPEQFRDKFCILFIGRLSNEKSHMVLLRAVEKSKYSDRIQLFFAGNGPKYQKIKSYGDKHLKNPPIINFYSRTDLVKLINFCDLYCHPAEIEIEAIACLEAICCGLVPIIADSPRCATKSFALDERCLFRVNDSLDLAAKIDYFIENPAKIQKLRQLYLNESTSFEQTACMEKMEQMLMDQIH
ncbi:MAG: glycosyltransferase [Eubacteriales bacterium]|nr:glycosyltransferase [Eubacteriales bacterium]MDY4897447.1 glycosyltransferase [Eubacteriales bacterium]